MKPSIENIRNKLAEKGLKVTPQRLVILDAVYQLGNHPTADQIIGYIREKNPNIASGTVYKVLDTLIDNNLIKKVTTDKNVMRYDGMLENHHHLYCSESDTIEDYVDEELDRMLSVYFQSRNLKGFHITRFSLQINGVFDKENPPGSIL